MEYFINNFQIFLLIMVRMTGMFVIAPFFSSFAIPTSYKLLLSVIITMIIFPIVSNLGIKLPGHAIVYGLLVIEQLLIGIIIGFICAVLFTIFQLAGQFFSFQMGLGINEVFDPLSQIQIPIIGQFQSLVAILIFLQVSGHHSLISAVYKSYKLLPIVDWTSKNVNGILTKSLVESFSMMFALALKISFPIIGVMFLVSVSLGLLAKAAPQMNILMLGFPIQIGIGLISIMVIGSFFVEASVNVIQLITEKIMNIITALR